MSCDGKCFATCAELLPRAEAAARCAAWGGTLATLHDADENACLQSLLVSHVWLGYEQSATSVDLLAGWSWVDGVTSSYVNWRAGEPNDIDMVEDGEENCAIMFETGPWNDYECDVVDPALACSR